MASAAVPLKLPVNPCVDIVEPVTVIPFVKSTVPLKYDAVIAVVANDAVSAYEADVIEPSTFCASEAYEAVTA